MATLPRAHAQSGAEPLLDTNGLYALQQLIDAVPFYVLLVDDLHNVLAANKAAVKELGPVCVGGYCPRVVHGSEEPFPGCPLELCVAHGHGLETELWDGERERWMLSGVYPTRLASNQGRPVYLHFARDITDEKRAQEMLEQSLEHHKALGRLLQMLRDCQSPERTLAALIGLTLDLSWMDATCGAGAFLVRGEVLELVTARNLPGAVKDRCSRVHFGECLCGEVAQEGAALLHTDHGIPKDHPHHPDVPPHGHAILPLVYEGRTLGVVNFYIAQGQRVSDAQTSFLEAAVGVTAAALAEQLAREEAREAQTKTALLERRLLEKVLLSQEDERKRVARELHDDLGQGLSALLLDVQSMAHRQEASGELTQLEGAVRELIAKTYQLAYDLRPAMLDDLGLEACLAQLVQKAAQRSGLQIDYQFIHDAGSRERMPAPVEIVLYRLTQEALSNVLRHAAAACVSVIVFCRHDSVILMVEDDGRGFCPDPMPASEGGAGLGLLGMRERVALLSGQLVVESAPGAGTSLKATLPLAMPTLSDDK
jgi:signal transduction histidine kinase